MSAIMDAGGERSMNGTRPDSDEVTMEQLLATDPRHKSSGPDTLWTTTNIGEALPGVITPLGWSVWGPACERGLRRTFDAFGVLTPDELAGPAGDHDRIVSIFFGRPALRADFILTIGERMPGTSGAEAAEALFAVVPEGYVSRPERRFYPRAAARIPGLMLRSPRLLRAARIETDRWWRREVARLPRADAQDALRSLEVAADRFTHNAHLHMLVTFSVVQSAYDLLSKIIEDAGVGSSLMAGGGDHEETRFVHDLWACSRDRLDLTTFLGRHGYHGPNEGEVSGRVWREDRRPLVRMLASYRDLGPEADPRLREIAFQRERERDAQRLLSALPGRRRAQARAILAYADRSIPLRGVGKVAFLQGLDVLRAAARRAGESLASDGILDDPEDVFFLTREEIRDREWGDARERVQLRRRCHSEYERLDLPVTWHGMPQAELIGGSGDAVDTIEGIGASGGVVEGRVRVVTEPGDIALEPDEILVARATDPGWAAIMFLSAGLVMDIGGTLSHAAVVARELGIPCVANTRVATSVLRTGDRCRVDGTTGRIDVLERAPA